LSTEYGWLSAFHRGFPPSFTQVIPRRPGVTRWNVGLIAHGNALSQEALLIRSPRFRGDRLRLSGGIRMAFSRGSRGAWRAAPGRSPPCDPSCDDEDDHPGESSLP